MLPRYNAKTESVPALNVNPFGDGPADSCYGVSFLLERKKCLCALRKVSLFDSGQACHLLSFFLLPKRFTHAPAGPVARCDVLLSMEA
jgi:hypothetical protein